MSEPYAGCKVTARIIRSTVLQGVAHLDEQMLIDWRQLACIEYADDTAHVLSPPEPREHYQVLAIPWGMLTTVQQASNPRRFGLSQTRRDS